MSRLGRTLSVDKSLELLRERRIEVLKRESPLDGVAQRLADLARLHDSECSIRARAPQDEAFLYGSVTICACSFTIQGEQMPNALTPEKLRDLARSGAEAALKQLRAEIIAIERTFPELALPKRRKAIQKSLTRATRDARRMSAAARKAVSERMKKYWAERRKAKARVK
jgi:hypothetical protein